MHQQIRVRFAPSPTGHLHIGGARTALFNWLFAKKHNGVFILRIEDTDTSRSTEEYIQSILQAMKWLGLLHDEGPYRQTSRFDIYREYVQRLLDANLAYYCTCSPEELEGKRQHALAEGRQPKYDRTCKSKWGNKKPDIPYTVRFSMPETGQIVLNDLIRGEITFENSVLEDMIILRSDGTPTYNFCVVIDDIDMQITHVIRGDDHINNTPKQIHLYNALAKTPPLFAHLPMILGSDKTRLSKRHAATSVLAYKEMGYLPEALLNYLARLGWSHGDREIFTISELIEYFDIANVGKSSAVFNPEKLLWLNSQYIMSYDAETVAQQLLPFLAERYARSDWQLKWLAKAVKTLQPRAKTLAEMADAMKIYIEDDIPIEPKASAKFLTEANKRLIIELAEGLVTLEPFEASALEKLFHDFAESKGIKLGSIAQPVRVALTGTTASPGIFEVIEILGKEKTLKRLREACSGIK